MSVCFDGLKSGPICLGDLNAQLHGSELGLGYAGLGIVAIVVVAVAIFIFRSPA